MTTKLNEVKQIDVFPNQANSFLIEILQTTQPVEKIEKNLFQQYLKSTEHVPAGMTRRPTPAFLSKMIEKERKDFMDQKRLSDFDFIPMMKGFCEEYKIDFDLRLANYYKGLILRCGTEIYDLECLDQNAPPIFP